MTRTQNRFLILYAAATLIAAMASPGCHTSSPTATPASSSPTGQQLVRSGDEIVVCGQLFHTNTPVVLWTDPGGYDAYRVERRFAPWKDSAYSPTTREAKGITSPARLGVREQVLSDAELEQVRGGGWPLELLQQKVDQFVLHYDVAGTSRGCFRTLHDYRGLSVQFMLDLDGTIYQTCDLKERAFHATKSNPRSVGIEIANMGAYTNIVPLKEWYAKDATGHTAITIPKRLGDGGIRDRSVVLRPDRDDLVAGTIHGVRYRQYDLTPQQYASLTRLIATLGTVLPRITMDYPRDSSGKLITTNLTDEEWKRFTGVLGHFHVQHEKQDPGPAMQWDRVMEGARRLMSTEALKRNEQMRGEFVEIRPGSGTGAKPAAATQPALP